MDDAIIYLVHRSLLHLEEPNAHVMFLDYRIKWPCSRGSYRKRGSTASWQKCIWLQTHIFVHIRTESGNSRLQKLKAEKQEVFHIKPRCSYTMQTTWHSSIGERPSNEGGCILQPYHFKKKSNLTWSDGNVSRVRESGKGNTRWCKPFHLAICQSAAPVFVWLRCTWLVNDVLDHSTSFVNFSLLITPKVGLLKASCDIF